MLVKMTPQQYCLRWKHHHSNVQSMFAQLLEKERFCDVTLYCSSSFSSQLPDKGDLVDPASIRGVSVRAHRVVLAACSELLGSLLGAHEAQGEPVLVIDGAAPSHVRALLDYMYTGEMSVHHEELPGLLKTAEELRIKGLTDIRWNNKDEPPDSKSGAVTTVAKKQETNTQCRKRETQNTQCQKQEEPICVSPDLVIKEERQHNVNGGPPPLIKLNTKEKVSLALKRDAVSDTTSETPSPKRQRATSGTDHTDDEDRDQESWKHGNLDITAERVLQWGGEENASEGSWERDKNEEDEWGDAPADIGSFLDTRLRVDGDNSLDDSSTEEPTPASKFDTSMIDLPMIKTDMTGKPLMPTAKNQSQGKPLTTGPKSGPSDPRFTDVVKLNDYLRHGRRPQFWEEDYVKRVMEAVRLKELEMKQAAEILGVSYGTLYGRYRDVYGCINRPYRNARDFYSAKAPSEVLDRLQRGEIPADVAAQALGVSARELVQHLAELQQQIPEPEFEPIPIEIDPLLKMKTAFPPSISPRQAFKTKPQENKPKRVVLGSIDEEIPATVISTVERRPGVSTTTAAGSASVTNSASGKWPSIRVTNLETLRASSSSSSEPTSPTLLMRSRPDLTIVAARKPDPRDPENGT